MDAGLRIDQGHPILSVAQPVAARRVIGTFRPRAHERIDLVVRLHVVAGLDLPAAVGSERRLREDIAREPYAGAKLGEIVGVAQVVEPDAWFGAWVRGAQPHRTAALRAHRADVGLEAVLLRERGAVVGHREREAMELDVGIWHVRTSFDEADDLEVAGRP